MPAARNADLTTAQASFVRWLQDAVSVGADLSLQLWCKLNSVIDANPALSRIQVNAAAPGAVDAEYAEVERGIVPLVKDIVAPVLGALAAGALFLALDLGAGLAAIAALLVFCVLLLRNGGSLDGISAWIEGKLALLKSFAAG